MYSCYVEYNNNHTLNQVLIYDKMPKIHAYITRADSTSDKPKVIGNTKAKFLLTNIANMIRKSESGKIFINHKFISRITHTKNDQNRNILMQLKDIIEFTYYNSIIFEGKIRTYGYIVEFTKDGEERLRNTQKFYTTPTALKKSTTANVGTEFSCTSTIIYNNKTKNIDNLNNLNSSDSRQEDSSENTDTVRDYILWKVDSDEPDTPPKPTDAEVCLPEPTPETSAKVNKPRYTKPLSLKDFADKITQTHADKINKALDRFSWDLKQPYCLKFIKDLMISLSIKKPQNRFRKLDDVEKYLTKALSYEKRPPCLVNNMDFRIKAVIENENNSNQKEDDMRKTQPKVEKISHQTHLLDDSNLSKFKHYFLENYLGRAGVETEATYDSWFDKLQTKETTDSLVFICKPFYHDYITLHFRNIIERFSSKYNIMLYFVSNDRSSRTKSFDNKLEPVCLVAMSPSDIDAVVRQCGHVDDELNMTVVYN